MKISQSDYDQLCVAQNPSCKAPTLVKKEHNGDKNVMMMRDHTRKYKIGKIYT